MSKEDIMNNNENKKRGFLSTVFASLFSTTDEEIAADDNEVKKIVEKMQAESQANINNIENQCFSYSNQKRAELNQKLKAKGLEISVSDVEKEKTEKVKSMDEGMER